MATTWLSARRASASHSAAGSEARHWSTIWSGSATPTASASRADDSRPRLLGSLGYLEDAEPAAELVADLLGVERPLMSWINLGEVHNILRRSQGEGAAIATVRDLREVIEVRLPDEHLVLDAARIRADYPMAYANAFGAALSVARDATLWTGDPELLVEDSPWHWRDLRTSA